MILSNFGVAIVNFVIDFTSMSDIFEVRRKVALCNALLNMKALFQVFVLRINRHQRFSPGTDSGRRHSFQKPSVRTSPHKR